MEVSPISRFRTGPHGLGVTSPETDHRPPWGPGFAPSRFKLSGSQDQQPDLIDGHAVHPQQPTSPQLLPATPIRAVDRNLDNETSLFLPSGIDAHTNRKRGSPQESDETRILGRFLEDYEFGSGRRHSLGLQQAVAQIF